MQRSYKTDMYYTANSQLILPSINYLKQFGLVLVSKNLIGSKKQKNMGIKKL